MKLAIFDLDGVLATTTEIHTKTLRMAVERACAHNGIAHQEAYLDGADGIRTVDKLKRLAASYGFSDAFIAAINKDKTTLAVEELSKLKPNQEIIDGIVALKARGYDVGVASNSRRLFVDIVLKAIGLDEVVDFTIAGDELTNPKPDPEIFLRSMKGYDLNDVYIFEDSPTGLAAARATGATVIEVNPDTLVTANQFLLCK
jgi:HAD superfamily hydrolase (TIGR01509 family)